MKNEAQQMICYSKYSFSVWPYESRLQDRFSSCPAAAFHWSWGPYCDTLILSCFSHPVVDVLLCLWSFSCCMSWIIQAASWLKYMILEYFGISRSSWSSQWLQRVQVTVLDTWYEVCWYVVFGCLQMCAVHHSQASPLWAHQGSVWHCFNNTGQLQQININSLVCFVVL